MILICPLMGMARGLWKIPDGRTDWGINWVLFWWVGPCSVNLQSNFLLKGGAVFPPCYLTWGQIMVEVMKIMLTSFKRSHACSATLSAPNPAAGHHQPPVLPETPIHSLASLGQSLMESLLLFPGSWWAQGSVCTIPESVFPVLCKFWWLYGGLMVTSSKRAYTITRSTAPRASAKTAVHC